MTLDIFSEPYMLIGENIFSLIGALLERFGMDGTYAKEENRLEFHIPLVLNAK